MLNAIDAGTMCIETNVASPDAITSLMPSASDCIDAWEQQELFETARRVICRVVADAIKACIPELPNGVVVELKLAGKTFRIAQSAPLPASWHSQLNRRWATVRPINSTPPMSRQS